MSFGYPKEIFPYPAVQYIPINYYNLEINPTQAALPPQIYVFSKLSRANQIASRYNMSLASSKELQSNELLLMTIGAQVEDIKYRAYRVIMLTSQPKNLIHTFKITTDYFYKDRLVFILYQTSGAQLATQRFNL